jgi:hypothetical protein
MGGSPGIYLVMTVTSSPQTTLKRRMFFHSVLKPYPKLSSHSLCGLLMSEMIYGISPRFVRLGCKACVLPADSSGTCLHQLLFAVRSLCGTLNEAWVLIKTDWDDTGLGKQLSPQLSATVRESLKFLRRYFGNSSLLTKLRNEFAFHYFSSNLPRVIDRVEETHEHEFITGKLSGNTFYGFAEKLLNFAMVDVTGDTDVLPAVRRLYDEPSRAYSHFIRFSDAVLFEIAKRFRVQTESFETTMVIDPRDVPSVIFIDENKSSST